MRQHDRDSSEAGVAAEALLAEAGRDRVAILPIGAGVRHRRPEGAWDGLPWISTKFQSIRRWAIPDFTVEADAGLTMAVLNAELAGRGQWLPVGTPDGGADTLGGIVSAGLSGVWAGGCGLARDRILAMTVATPAFGVVRLGAPVVKNVAGYNLWRLYWATHGAFGLILTITWKLAPLPRAAAILECAGDGPEMAAAFAEARRWRAAANAWAALLLNLRGPGWTLTGVAHGGDAHVERVRRELGATVQPQGDLGAARAQGGPVAWQARLPLAGLPPFLEWIARSGAHGLAELQSGVVWGFRDSPDPQRVDEVAALARQHGGSFRSLSEPWPAPSVPAAEGDMWRRLKASVDPQGVLPALGGDAEGKR